MGIRNLGKRIISSIYALNPLFILPLILLLALATRIVFFNGLGFSDDLQYSYDAFRVTSGAFSHCIYNLQMRLGIILPIALFYKIFGIHEWSLILYSLLCSLGLIVVTFLLGRMFFNEKIGLLSAFFLIFYPLDVEYATTAMPDVPQAFWIALGIYLFLCAHKSMEESKFKISGFFASGIVIGISYLARDTGIILIFFMGLYLILSLFFTSTIKNGTMVKSGALAFLSFLTGFAVVFCAEGIFHLIDMGDFFMRFHVVSSYYTRDPYFISFGVNQDLTFYPRTMFHLDKALHFAGGYHYYPYGLFFYAFVPAILYTILFRVRQAWIPLLWFFFLMLYLQYGSMSITEYVPIHRLSRHLSVITVSSILILSYTLYELFTKLNNKKSRFFDLSGKIFIALFILTLMITSFHFIKFIHAQHNVEVYDARHAFRELEKYPDKLVFVDESTLGYFLFLDKYRNLWRFKPYANLVYKYPGKEKIIIIDSTRGFIENPEMLEIPVDYKNCSKHWILLAEIRGPEYSIWGEFNPRIYLMK